MNKNISRIAVVMSLCLILPVLSASGCAGREDDYVSYDLQSLEPVPEAEAESDIPQDNIYVYVCGQVENPGVYQVDESARVFELINLAGGVREGADLSSINQAEKVLDGQQIYVPEIGENQGGEGAAHQSAAADDGLININTADIAELTKLPGIGEARARAIIDYRQQQGSFKKPEDIMNVTGIKEGMYGKISDKIKVN